MKPPFIAYCVGSKLLSLTADFQFFFFFFRGSGWIASDVGGNVRLCMPYFSAALYVSSAQCQLPPSCLFLCLCVAIYNLPIKWGQLDPRLNAAIPGGRQREETSSSISSHSIGCSTAVGSCSTQKCQCVNFTWVCPRWRALGRHWSLCQASGACYHPLVVPDPPRQSLHTFSRYCFPVSVKAS